MNVLEWSLIGMFTAAQWLFFILLAIAVGASYLHGYMKRHSVPGDLLIWIASWVFAFVAAIVFITVAWPLSPNYFMRTVQIIGAVLLFVAPPLVGNDTWTDPHAAKQRRTTKPAPKAKVHPE